MNKELLDRYFGDRLENAAGNRVRIALAVRTTVFEVTFVAVVDEAVWHTDRSTAVGEAVAELVDGLCFMQTGEAHVVVGTIDGDVLVDVFLEGGHEFFEVFFAASFAHVFGGEVAVHTGAVPVGRAEWFAMVFHIDAVAFANAIEDVTSDPDFVSRFFGAFAEDLEFPLTFGHFGVDAFVVDASFEAKIEVLLDDLTGDIADVFITYAAIVRALRSGVAVFRETEGTSILIEEIFLLEAEPSAGIVEDGSTGVGGVRSHAIGHHDLAHDQRAIEAGGVGVDRHWLENAVRAAAFGLLGGTTVKAPVGKLIESGELLKCFDLSFATKVSDGGVAVEPDILQFEFGHGYCCLVDSSRADIVRFPQSFQRKLRT